MKVHLSALGCRLNQGEIDSMAREFTRRGDEIVMIEPRRSLAAAFEALASMPEDFFADGRKDEPPQEREDL